MYGLGDFEDSSSPPAPNLPSDTGEDARIEAMFGWLVFGPNNYTEMLHIPRTSRWAVGVQTTRTTRHFLRYPPLLAPFIICPGVRSCEQLLQTPKPQVQALPVLGLVHGSSLIRDKSELL